LSYRHDTAELEERLRADFRAAVNEHRIFGSPFFRLAERLTRTDLRRLAHEQYYVAAHAPQAYAAIIAMAPDRLVAGEPVPYWETVAPVFDLLTRSAWGNGEPGSNRGRFLRYAASLDIEESALISNHRLMPETVTFVEARTALCNEGGLLAAIGGIAALLVASEPYFEGLLAAARRVAHDDRLGVDPTYFEGHAQSDGKDAERLLDVVIPGMASHARSRSHEEERNDFFGGIETMLDARAEWLAALARMVADD